MAALVAVARRGVGTHADPVQSNAQPAGAQPPTAVLLVIVYIDLS